MGLAKTRHDTQLPRCVEVDLPAKNISEELGDLRFRALLPDNEWEELPLDVQRRFTKRLAGGRTAVYVGRITQFQANMAGRLLSQMLRLIGGPLPLCDDIDVPSVVTVTEDVETAGQIWTRLYANRTGFPQVIHSSKRFAGPTGLEEYIGFGISMGLRVSVEDQVLTFRSAGNHVRLGPLRLRLPRWLEPGALTVIHRDEGEQTFVFGLLLKHPLFGRLVRQEGLYREELL